MIEEFKIMKEIYAYRYKIGPLIFLFINNNKILKYISFHYSERGSNLPLNCFESSKFDLNLEGWDHCFDGSNIIFFNTQNLK